MKLEKLILMLQRGYLITNDSAMALKVAYKKMLGKVKAEKEYFNAYFSELTGKNTDWVAFLCRQKKEVKKMFRLAATVPELNFLFGDTLLASYRSQQGQKKSTMEAMMRAAAAYNVGHFCGLTTYSEQFRKYYLHFQKLDSSIAYKAADRTKLD
jgi:predicted TIM-barrel fold metal-dependent hydrolase